MPGPRDNGSMKSIFLALCLTLVFSGCNGSDSGSTSIAAVEGVDFSGTYNFQDVECYDSSGTETASEAFTAFDESMTIIGNSLVATATSPGCVVDITENIVFSSSASSTGATITDVAIQSATGGGCTLVKTLSGSSISPTTVDSPFTTGESIGNVSANYLWVSPHLGVPTGYSDGSGDTCYLVFTKQ